jgi:GNAT superfamily N-acetyltransferase
VTHDLSISRLDPAHIDLVSPLWKALLDHIAVLPDAVVPIRPFEQSWPIERELMLEALAKDAFILVARRGDQLVGYAFVTIEDADPVWYTGDKYADLAHLSVAEDERGTGVGSVLFDAVDEELARRGIDDVQIGVDAANHDAVRFYEERGYRGDYQVMYGSPGRKPPACLRRDQEDRRAGRGRYAPPAPGPKQ